MARTDGRCVVSVTMQPELYEKLRVHCKELDTPVSVWVRQLLKESLEAIDDS